MITLDHVKRLQAFTGEFVSMPGGTRDALVEAAEALDDLVIDAEEMGAYPTSDAHPLWRARRALEALGVLEPRA